MRISQTLSSLLALVLMALLSAETLAETKYRIRSADNINSIVNRFYPDRIKTKAQIMIGLLIENPRAFKGGNVNFLLRGKRMRILDEADLSDISNDEAKELLSQQAFFFREGVTGAEYLSPIKKSDFKKSNKKTSVKTSQSQKAQQQKISKLEKEGKDLKKRLDDLFQEKRIRDKKLVELEESIRNSNKEQLEKQSLKPTDISQVEQKNKALEERNTFLQQSLQESKSKLAENTRSNIQLERRLDTLKNKKIVPQKEISVAKPTPQAKRQEVVVTPNVDYKALWNKYNWVLVLIFLPLLFWTLIKFKRRRDLERDGDYASQIAEIEANSFLQQGKNIQSDNGN